MQSVYFDHNATTPVADEVRAKLSEWAELWGNPSSIHWAGRGPKNLMRESRKNVATLLGCDTLETVFTAGGSEANNLAIKGLRIPGRNHYLFSSVEHPSVREAMKFLKEQGADVEVFPVGRGGEIDLDLFRSKLRPDTALVSFMLANNETGVIFPIKKMAAMAHEAGALFHSDCVQALGKMLFNVRDLDVDLATISGHKFYALKGAGCLYVKRGVNLTSLIHGGGQERHRRAGTENLLAIASFGLVATKKNEIPPKIKDVESLRDRFEELVGRSITGVTVTSGELKRLCNTSSLVIEGAEGESLLMNLDMEGYAVSTGAACSSGSPEPSPTLLAMGLSRDEAQTSLRVSFGWQNTWQEVEGFVEVLVRVVERIRKFREVEQHV